MKELLWGAFVLIAGGATIVLAIISVVQQRLA